MSIKVNMVYFQNDLRVHDHPGLWSASQSSLPIIGLFIRRDVDSLSPFGFTKKSKMRGQFLHRALAVLKKSLQEKNIPLLVFDDIHSPTLQTFINSVHVETWFTSLEPGSEEKQKENSLLELFKPSHLKRYASKSLLHPSDYPFLMKDLPSRFTDARMRIEKNIQVRPLIPSLSPHKSSASIAFEEDGIPSSEPVWFDSGEEAGLKHLHDYFFTDQHVLTYKLTRNNMLKFEDSSKLSPYLALGCLSPRMIYWELKKVEKTIEKNQSTYWLWFELLWRDYFYFLHLNHGNAFFFLRGTKNKPYSGHAHHPYEQAILKAKTGYPIVDANLQELYQTGWMSNRGRQNVASFIVHGLHLDWRWGAALYEHFLLDFDVSSNYGNWQYLAGVGNDPREDRVFNVSLQLKKYDAKGDYIRHWIPALKNVPTPELYQPWTMNDLQQNLAQCIIGKDYPFPIIDDARFQLR